MRRIALLGSTGSIGRQAIAVCDGDPALGICGLAAHSDVDGVLREARRLGVKRGGEGAGDDREADPVDLVDERLDQPRGQNGVADATGGDVEDREGPGRHGGTL